MKFNVTGMTCSACSAHVEKAVKAVIGVNFVTVNLLTNSMQVTFGAPATSESIISAVVSAGYGATVEQTDTKPVERTSSTPTVSMIKRLVASAVLLLPLMYVSMGYVMWGWQVPGFLNGNPVAAGLFELLVTALVMVINGRFFVSGFRSVVHGAPNMDTLVALGSAAAFIYSTVILFVMTSSPEPHHYLHELYFESAAMILTLVTFGKTLESYSKGKTTNAVNSLKQLAPKNATVIRDGIQTTIPAEEIKVGDIFAVKPGESFVADGIIISGTSAVDESALTGESLPTDKTVGNAVSAATINKSGYLECRATQVGSETSLSRIIRMVEDASAGKAPIAKIADKVSGVFVPSVIVIALMTCAIWLVAGNTAGFALARAISVLVISCPCALGLATPVAIMVGNGIGAKHGILFKTALALETTGKTQIVILDKTGTITEGKPTVTDIITANNTAEDQLLGLAAALEAKSEHPLARAVMEYVADNGINFSEAENFRAYSGSGVGGTVDGKRVFGGNSAFIMENGINVTAVSEEAEQLALQGKTPLYFAADGKIIGVIAVSDKEKADSAKAVARLENMGISVVMLTGDNRRTAGAVAKRTGIENIAADVLPDGKDAVVRRLNGYGKTVMVGDGINDAPALTSADVGIAVGAGTDVAIDAADVVLMKSGISDVPAAITLSRNVMRNIKENLFWAFIYNCIGIPIAAGALIPAFGIRLSPMIAAAAMSLSSVCVVTNALRLNLCNIYSEKHFGRLPVTLPEFENKKTEELPMKKIISINGMMCAHCTAHVEKALCTIDGVVSAKASTESKSATVTLSKTVTDEALFDAVKEAGYEPIDCKEA